MAHSGNPLDNAPVIKTIDTSSVARQRPAKVKKSRVELPIRSVDNDIIAKDNLDVVCTTPSPIIMAEPLPVLKDESRFSTTPTQIILNLFDQKLGYYLDEFHRVYRFEGHDLIVVGKYVNHSKLQQLTDCESKQITTHLRVRYAYDNNYFVAATLH